jgi:hypothetical protein
VHWYEMARNLFRHRRANAFVVRIDGDSSSMLPEVRRSRPEGVLHVVAKALDQARPADVLAFITAKRTGRVGEHVRCSRWISRPRTTPRPAIYFSDVRMDLLWGFF